MKRAAVAPWLLVAAPLVVFVALFVLPLGNLAVLSFFRFDRTTGAVGGFTFDNYAKFLGDPFYLGILWRTFKLAVIVTLATLALGYPVALYLSRTTGRRRAYLMLLIMTPLLVSVVVRSFGWLVILGPNGLVSSALRAVGLIDEPLRLLYTETAIALGLTHVFLSFMVLSVATALGRIDPAVLRAAASLGAGPIRTFLKVILPLSLPGVAAGSVIVFTLSASAFITPALLGGPRVKVMSSLAYQQAMLLSDWPYGAAIALVLLALTTAGVLLYLRAIESGAREAAFR